MYLQMYLLQASAVTWPGRDVSRVHSPSLMYTAKYSPSAAQYPPSLSKKGSP